MCKQTVHYEIQIHGQNSNFKRDENYRKIKESELSGNMHIYTLCPKYLQSFTEFRTAVWEELHLQKVLTDWPMDGRFKNITVLIPQPWYCNCLYQQKQTTDTSTNKKNQENTSINQSILLYEATTTDKKHLL